SRGRMMLLFYEARPGLDDVKWVPSQKASYVTGLDVQLDVRIALIDGTGRGASARVTQYETGPDGKNLPLIAGDASGREYRAANRPNLPMYAAGTSPFIGDYLFLAPSMPFVQIGLPSAPAPSFATGASTILASTQKRDGKTDDDKKKKSGPFWRWATE